MPQGHSTAYQDFRASLRQADALLRIERGIPDPPSQEDIAAVKGLRGGAIVLMVAAFEGYLRSAFEERLDELGAVAMGARFDLLPSRIQMTSVFNLLNEAMSGAPGKSMPERRIDRLPDIRKAATSVSARELLGTAFSTTGGNPSSDSVKRLFKQVDCTDVFTQIRPRFARHWQRPIPQDFARRQLDFIVEARHEVAHGENVLAWSRQDLKAAERFVRILGKSLDEELRIHLNAIHRIVQSGTP